MFDESQGLNLSIIESNRISFEAESVYNYEKFKFNWTVVSFKN